MCHFACYSFVVSKIIVNNIFPAVRRGCISPRARNRLRPKGLKVCSYVEKCAEFKNQTLKKIGWYTKVLCATDAPGVCNISK